MKIRKYLPIIIMFCLCVCSCVVGAYAFNSTNVSIHGNVNISAGSPALNIEYGIEISNAAKNNAFSLQAPEKIYINSNNSVNGNLIAINSETPQADLGNLFFSSHSEDIDDIQITIILKNNSVYPALVNFSFANNNTVGLHSDLVKKEVYLSSSSQALGESAVLYRDYGLSVYDFFLKLNNPTSHLSQNCLFALNISFDAATGAEDISSTLPVTHARIADDRLVSYLEVAETTIISDFITSNKTAARTNKPFTFEFNLPFGITNSTFALDTDYKFTNAKTYNLSTNSITLENLMVDTNYFYRITFTTPKGDAGYKMGIIATEKTPRMLNIEGVYNTRDIGGWQTSVNIKQGMVLRGTEIDGAVESAYCATAKGLNTLKELGIVTDFDLRGNTTSTPIEGAKILSFSSQMYHYAFASEHNNTMKNIFTELAKPQNYPMYIHCTYGCDRTGTICFLLEALLGASDLELTIEYEFSSLISANINRNYSVFISFLNALQNYSGNTIQEKVVSYMLSIGITEEQIQSIRDILLQK